MALEIPITERSRRYGYIYWPSKMDEKVQQFFGDTKTVDVMFEGSNIGVKKIDRKYRRISVGWSQTRPLDEALTVFRLTFLKNKRLKVTCR